MSKRSTEDIENISDGNESVKKPARRSTKKATSAESTVDGVAPKKRSSKKASAQATIEVAKGVAVADHDDPELQNLLFQVDHMLTEMTQSKWLSKDWPSLEIDFGNSNKK